MADQVKVHITEKNGVELEFAEEYSLVAENIPFDDPEFTATTVAEAIGEAKDAAGADEAVKVSSNDTTAGYLNGKLVAGTNITLTENGDGGNETLTIDASGGGSSVFGSEFHYAESESTSSTTSTSYQTKVSLTTGSLPTGNYVVFYTFVYKNSNKEKMTRVQVRLNTGEISTNISTPKFDQSGSWLLGGGHKHFADMSGVQTFDIRFKRVTEGTAQIQDARITFWRVS
jgi:hypothetical protein